VTRLRLAVPIAALAALASGTGRAAVQALDDAGTLVTLPSPARRIVSLAPHATELLFAAGAGERIVGVMSGSDHPAAATALPVVGTSSALDLEHILALRPDLIVTWPYTTPAQVEVLRARGIRSQSLSHLPCGDFNHEHPSSPQPFIREIRETVLKSPRFLRRFHAAIFVKALMLECLAVRRAVTTVEPLLVST
jgi:ABC-type Fe3+-hydroxamate transport system substrate-binding protein